MKRVFFFLVATLLLVGLVSGATLLKYPDIAANAGLLNNTDGTFYAVRNGIGDQVLNSSSGTQSIGLATTSGSTYNWISRGGFVFDTSILNETDTIDSATLSLYSASTTTYQNSAGSLNFCVTAFNPTTPNNLVMGDYDKFGSTPYSSAFLVTNWAAASYNAFTLNDAGEAAINKEGNTLLMVRVAQDIDNTSVGITEGTSKRTSITFYTSDYSGSSRDPKLTIEYTIAAGGDTTPPASITGFTNSSVTCVGCTLNWTEPVDADLNHTMMYMDNVLIINETNATQSHIFTGLNGWQTYTFSTKTCDTTGNCNTTWVNQTVTISPVCKIINYIRQFYLPYEMVRL